jgi:hypothetical protein
MSLFDYELDPAAINWLFRVQVPGTATKFVNGALISGGVHYTPEIIAECAGTFLHEHFLWTSSYPSPFISVFTDEDHARNWATGLVRKNAGYVCDIYRINPFQLGGNAVFDASELVRRLDIELPKAARSQAQNEYLVLRSIPAEANSFLEVVRDSSIRMSAPVAGLGNRLRLQLPPLTPPKAVRLSCCFSFAQYNVDNDDDNDSADDVDGQPRYGYQDQVVDSLVARITAFIDDTLNDCGEGSRNQRRAVARIRDGLTDNLKENAK